MTTDQCEGAGLVANGDFLPGLVPYDLSRGGGLFQFNATATIKQQALYVQDDLRAGNASFKLGLRWITTTV